MVKKSTSKRELDQARRKARLEPEPSVAVSMPENPDESSAELLERVERGEAFIFGGTGITKKEEEKLFNEAVEKLLPNKQSPPKIHVLSLDGVYMKIVE